MNLKKWTALTSTILMTIALLLVGCQTAAPTAAPRSGKLTISGSTSMLELVQELAAKYMDINGGVTIDVQGGGSSVGLQNCVDGISDIGNSSSALKDTDTAKGLVGTDIAMDGVAVVVNPNNPVSDLAKNDIVKIFKGEITNWKDVSGADHEITVVNREASSGTREAMGKLFGLSAKDADGKTVEYYTEKALEQNSTGGVVTTVAGDEYAIGYISVGSVKDSVKPLAVGGVKAGKETILNGTYKYWRPFVMVTKGEPQGPGKAFIDWCLKDPAAIEIVNGKYIAMAEKK